MYKIFSLYLLLIFIKLQFQMESSLLYIIILPLIFWMCYFYLVCRRWTICTWK